jgi:hypothetical protein
MFSSENLGTSRNDDAIHNLEYARSDDVLHILQVNSEAYQIQKGATVLFVQTLDALKNKADFAKHVVA